MSQAPHIRQLEPDDRPQLDTFLAKHPATTMFMQSNLQAAGIVGLPRNRHEGVYVGVFQDDELVAVASQNSKGMLLVAGQQHLADAARLAVRAAGLDLLGIAPRRGT